MMNRTALPVATVLLFTAIAATAKIKPGDSVPDFSLKNTDGRMVSMAQYKDAKGFIVVFTCNHCPYAKKYEDRLMSYDKKYRPLGYPVIAISSSDPLLVKADSWEAMGKRAHEKGYTFPYLLDDRQITARAFDAVKTPHAYVVTKETGGYVVKYSGAIDDNAAEPAKITRHFVTDAVDALLAGKPVPVAQTMSIGCEIKYKK